LCETLMKIGHKCVLQITKCFSREDINMMREQHIKSMAGYYSSLYENIDLSGCEALKAFAVQEENDEEYNYIDEYEEYEEDGQYTGDNKDNSENYDYYDEESEGAGGSQQIAPPSMGESDKSGVTSAITTSSKQAVTEPSPSSGDVAPSVADAAHQKRAPSQLPSSQLADDVSTASTASMQAVNKLSTSVFSAVIATVVAVNLL